MKKIAIVTVDFNGHKDTDELLASIQKLGTKSLEVMCLVVDNGSDISVRDTISKYPGVVWMQTGKNLGFAGGFNRGMKYAKEWGADFVLIINNDTLLPDKNLLQNLLSVFENHPKAGLVSPKIYFAPTFEFYKKKYLKENEGKVIWYAGGRFDWDNIRSIHRGIDEVDNGQFDKTEKTDLISGCCILVKREVMENVGYFEEKLFSYYEDADWIQRVKKAGYEMYYDGTTNIYHKVSRTAVIGSPWSDYLITRNRLWFGLKYASLRTKFALIRESIRFLISGRSAQKDGVIDYFRGVWGWKRAKQPEKVNYPLELSVVVINYKTTKLTLQLLKSIYDDTKSPDAHDKKSGFNSETSEVVVLDNSPEDSCKNEVISIYPQVKFISNKVNNGFAAGNNQLIDYSLGKNILLLNSDIEVKTNGIGYLLSAAEELGDRAIYAGRLFFDDGKLQDSCFKLPTPWRAFEQYFLNIKSSYFMSAPTGENTVKVEGAVMASYLIPRNVLNEIGNLQESTFMYFEDIEYARRAKKNSIPVYYVPKSEFIHYHGQSSKQAGLATSNERLIKAAKWYHGPFEYFLVTAVLWAGQKWGRVSSPVSRWKNES
jgi:GT2 family glycosyltransferase